MMTQRIPTEQDYQGMIQAGESQFVEFKRAAVAPKHLAEDLVAFANACPEPVEGPTAVLC